MKRTAFFVLIFVLILPINGYAVFQFQNFLKLGVTSSEVKSLQQFLNTDITTRVAIYGPGSPGFETETFGPLTQKAVISFQKNHGLVADGLVGSKTRGKLNEILLTKNPSLSADEILAQLTTVPKTTSSNNTSIQSSNPLSISTVSPENVIPGEVFDLYGSGFSKSDSVYFATDIKQKVSFDYINSGHIKIRTPNTGYGTKLVYVKNSISDTSWDNPVFILVTDKKIDANSSSKTLLEKIKRQNQKFTKVADAEMSNGRSRFFDKSDSPIKDFWHELFSPKEAIAAGVQGQFGGRILFVVDCTCPDNPGKVLHVNDLATNQVISVAYKTGVSTLHAHNMLDVTANVIGGTISTEFVCEETVGEGCVLADTAQSLIDTLRGVGTSFPGI